MATPKKANTIPNANTDNQFDWVKDAAGNRRFISLLGFVAQNERSLTEIHHWDAKEDAPARAQLCYTEVNPDSGEQVTKVMWASREASNQIASHWNKQTKSYTKGTLAGLQVGEYYVQDPDTKARVQDMDGNDVTEFRLIKSSGEGSSIKDVNALM